MEKFILIIKIIYYVVFYLMLLYSLYFLIMSLFAFKKSKKVKNSSKYQNRFAIIIAARNEENVIGNLIMSLKKQNYDEDKYTIYVVPNNCTDRTKERALECGAEVVDCKIKVKSKGEVLKYVFNKFKNRDDIDAYLIFDADNVVHPNFLKHMNDSLNKGFNVVQGFRDCKNITDNWLSGSYTLFYYFQNFFFNKSRRAINLSASINGTGFAVKKSLIDEMGFNTYTLTEDVEFTGLCSLRGEKIDFCEKAITYDEQPTKFMDSWKQRKRWSAGNLQCFYRYKKDLLKNFFKNKNISSLDICLSYMAPIIQSISFVLMIVLIIFNITGIKLYDIFAVIFSKNYLFFVVTYLIGIILSVFIIKLNKKKVSSMLSSVLLFSVFILTWIPINIVCLFKKNVIWEPIKHDRDVNIVKVLSK